MLHAFTAHVNERVGITRNHVDIETLPHVLGRSLMTMMSASPAQRISTTDSKLEPGAPDGHGCLSGDEVEKLQGRLSRGRS
ncbi:hypothetical protein [Amycolatopsis sp. NPDC051372]|uniref:hypothetical protein n=1 Tax=unclassified Amycolatopsis TaxID=2618356 RepID=UPI003445BB4B